MYLRLRVPLAKAVNDLLVCKDRHTFGTPIHRCTFFYRDAGIEQLKKNPLRPSVIRRIRC